MTTPNEKPAFRKSAETERAIIAMRAVPVGETITWAKLSETIGEDAQAHRAPVISARRELLKEGIVFSAVIGIGYKRLDDSGILESERGTPSRMVRAARKSIRKLSLVEPAKLTQDERTTYAVTTATIGAMALFGSRKNVAQIEQHVRDNGEIDAKQALKLFQ